MPQVFEYQYMEGNFLETLWLFTEAVSPLVASRA